jgi:hypothetical protein
LREGRKEPIKEGRHERMIGESDEGRRKEGRKTQYEISSQERNDSKQ